MFYVVYLKNADRCIVVPHHWLRDSQTVMLVRFINSGLNRNQLHLIFWSINGIHAAPNFNLDVASAYPPLQNEACYLCYVLKCFLTYNEAFEFAKKRRPFEPPIYNARRLEERPLPNIGADDVDMAVGQLLAEVIAEPEPPENENENGAALLPLPNIGADDVDMAVEQLMAEVIAEPEPPENENENEAALLPLPNIGAADLEMAAEQLLAEVIAEPEPPVNGNENGADVEMAINNAIKAEGDGEPIIDDEINQEPEFGHGNVDEIEQVKLEPIVNELSVEQMMELDDILVDDMSVDPLNCSSGPEGSNSNGNSDVGMPGTLAGCSYIHPQLGVDQNAKDSGTVDDSDCSDYEDAVGETKSNQITWVTVDEDVLIEHKSSYPFQPMHDPDFELLKQEDDIISGNIQFRDETRGRIYRIGNGFAVMPVKVVSSLSRWNSGAFRGLQIFDRKVVDVLVHICQDFINEKLNSRAVNRFIRELLKVRMGAVDDNRFTAVKEYIGESIEKQRTSVALKASQQNAD